MTHYHFIASNVEIESEYLKKAKVEMDEKFEESKCKVQYILEYDPSKAELTKVYETLVDFVANATHDYILLEIAYGLSAYGKPLKVDKRYNIDIKEFRKKHLIELEEDEMICIERNKWVVRDFENN
ncbi:hypothetical protein [Macrococcoides caseolyticum]|uniref:hypothetical protein n=1 Tax=Macrococcoides caseolyticum TaxID=69966 RepID=UPI001F3FB800|nr:hypothetical protein [Macrococcus caseolyticus]MCE4957992.1 hypothetical protein [Macrococcus caseolyticus]